MSTPVSVTTPPQSRTMHDASAASPLDLQAKMQRMIDLQYEQRSYDSAIMAAQAPPSTSLKQSSVYQNVDHPDDSVEPSTATARRPTQQAMDAPHSPFPDANVGKGTLIWRSSPSSEQQRLLSQHHTNPRVISSASTQGDDDTTHLVHHHSTPARDTLLPKTQSTHYALSSYGATNNTTTATTATTLDEIQPPPPPPLPREPPPEPRDYRDGHVARHVRDAFRRHDERERKRRQWTVSNCLYFVLGPFRRVWHTLLSATSLHRSFCYGAIDGMLTGAGIVSTFCGMHLLSTTTNNAPPIRALVVAFTAATCCADAVCMALGHMWTTHVLASAQAAERAQALQQLHHSKADAKGLLVDMLLAKGMLKIDAMSLADTLEGYPDLFVSALIGESFSGGVIHTMTSSTREQHVHYPTLRPPDMTASEHNLLLFETSGTSPGVHSASGVPAPLSGAGTPEGVDDEPWQRYPSYGRFESDLDHPHEHLVQSAEAESRKESLSMMLGFSLFSVIPSLIYTWVPAILLGSHDAAGIHIHPASQHVAAFVNPNTLVISLTACVMWCLGVWKSRFLDSNWLMFGIETVLVLLVCIAVAYGLGALLNKIFLPNDYLLEVVKQIVPSENGVSTPNVSVKASSSREQFPNHHFYIF